MRRLPIIPCLTCLLAAGLTTASAAPAAEGIVVRVKSGRTFQGLLDAKTDDTTLWLRSGREGVTISRPIAWSAVVEAAESGTAQARAHLIEQAARLRRTGVEANEAVPPRDDVATSKPPRRGSLQLWRTPAAPAALAPGEIVRWIEIDGYLANWDADVEADGLLLELEAFNAAGEIVPATGTLSVELIGETVPPYSRSNAAPMLASWTHALKPADFAGAGARIRLEFQNLHPDFDRVNGRFALVHVRLMVPGQGVFEASLDGVGLQGFSPVRERVEQAFGTRFLPTEATGRGHRESGFDLP